MKIQRIEFINARIKVVKCVINQTSLDITANQKSSLASATFLEEADRIIGKQHLYKRSVILIKVSHLSLSLSYFVLLTFSSFSFFLLPACVVRLGVSMRAASITHPTHLSSVRKVECFPLTLLAFWSCTSSIFFPLKSLYLEIHLLAFIRMLLVFLEMRPFICQYLPSHIRFMSYEHSSLFTPGFSGTSKSFPSLLSFTHLSLQFRPCPRWTCDYSQRDTRHSTPNLWVSVIELSESSTLHSPKSF